MYFSILGLILMAVGSFLHRIKAITITRSGIILEFSKD
jgi:hypothetical protein